MAKFSTRHRAITQDKLVCIGGHNDGKRVPVTSDSWFELVWMDPQSVADIDKLPTIIKEQYIIERLAVGPDLIWYARECQMNDVEALRRLFERYPCPE